MRDSTAEVVASRIRLLRRTAGWSQGRLGEATGLDTIKVNKIEACKRQVSVSELVAMARAFDVSPIVVLGLDNPLHLPEVLGQIALKQQP